jgi:ferric-dicitrate binding protein FerR (iron transport regulator)
LILNAGSTLSYHPFDWINNRQVFLEGEAFFEVKKGSDFQVETSQGTVEVLGTSFNVFARAEKFTVKCFTGKVKVKSEELEKVMEPGEGIRTDDHRKTESFNFKPNQEKDWRTGEFYFEDVPLEEVLKELQRQFDLRLEVQANLANREYTGQFSRSDLNEALKMVFLPMDLKYEYRQDSRILIIKP